MTAPKREIDVAWVPTAQAQLGTPEEAELLQAFHMHRHWLRDQKEGPVQAKALQKIDQVYKDCKKTISCAAGCAACCHARVDVSKHEKRLIEAHLQTTVVPIDQERLGVQAAALQAGTWDELPFAARQCVFLDSEKRCSIYEFRPLLCRRYFVTSDKKHCHTEDWGQIARYTHPDADAFLSAVFTRYKFEALPLFLSRR